MVEKNHPKTRTAKSKLLIVDDHPIVREHLTELIRRQEDLIVCGQAEDAAGAMQGIVKLKPDLVVLDLSLKGAEGTDLIKDIKKQFPHLPVLVVSMHDETLYAARCIRAGARGYINKQQATAVIISAIRRILNGEFYVSERMTNVVLEQFSSSQPGNSTTKMDSLSDRELEVFRFLGKGLTMTEIAGRLHVSVKTVETYTKRLKEKLDLASGTDLHKAAIDWSQTNGNA